MKIPTLSIPYLYPNTDRSSESRAAPSAASAQAAPQEASASSSRPPRGRLPPALIESFKKESETKQPFMLDELPFDMQMQIARHLDLTSKKNLRLTNQHLRQAWAKTPFILK